MRPDFFSVRSKPLMNPSWSDYGQILEHGMTAHLRREGGRLMLERTGPFIPPITLPGIGDIVLTSSARELLLSSGLSGFDFRPVRKALVVELHWEQWDLDAEAPELYPESGEPEDYILGQPNSATASTALGELWELVVPATATILRPQSIVRSYRELRLDVETWNGEDLFRSSDYGSTLFSERARDWFTERWSTYLGFFNFPST
jgi:hypothetical protein